MAAGGAKPHPDHFALHQTFTMIRLPNSSGWTLHHQHPGAVSFSSFLIMSFHASMLFVYFALNLRCIFEKNSFSHLRLRVPDEFVLR